MEERRQSLQAEVAQFISELQYDSLPGEIIEDAKYRLLDWLGGALVGARYTPSLIVTEMVKSNGGIAQATVLKGGLKVPLSQAVLANGIIGHIAEVDDGHRLAIAHPGAVTVPTALAIAETYNKTGKELLTGIIAGYEVIIRLGTAVNPSHYHMWHTTGTCGTFAAAAAAASVLKLDRDRVLMSLGIAGTMASGSRETFGTHAKALNVGHACQSGIQAALLAMKGFTGPEDILGGKKGFIKATSSNDNSKILEQINDSNFLSRTAYFKVYASCGHTNSPLDLIFMILQEHDLSPQSIRQVQIKTYLTAVELTGQFKNSNEEEAKFSLPYCIAVALLYKRVTLEEFSLDKLNDPLVAEIAAKIKITEDPEATRKFPRERRASIQIEMDNNLVIAKETISSKDAPDYSALEEKFISLASTCLERQSVETVKEMILGINKLDDLNMLMAHLM